MSINLASNLFSGLNDPKRNAALQEEFTKIDNNNYISNEYKDSIKYSFIRAYYKTDPLKEYIADIFKSKNINSILVDRVVEYCKKYKIYYRCFDNQISIDKMCILSNDIIDIFKFIEVNMNLPKAFIKDLCKISANINNVNIGKGEILISLCFNNMNLCKSGDCGDLYIINGNNQKFIYEVKADNASLKAYKIYAYKVNINYLRKFGGWDIKDVKVMKPDGTYRSTPVPMYNGYDIHHHDNFHRFLNDTYKDKKKHSNLEEFLDIIIGGVFSQNGFDPQNDRNIIKDIHIIRNFIIKNIYVDKYELSKEDALHIYELIYIYMLYIMEKLHMLFYIDSDTGNCLYIKNPENIEQLLTIIFRYFDKIKPGSLPCYENRSQGMKLGGFVYDKVPNKRGRPKKSN